MAKSTLPNPLQRRHLIERDLDSQSALALAEAYLAEGRREESLQFLGKAGATERLEALVEEAVETGDAFLLRSISDVTGNEPAPEIWERLAVAAEAAGKLRYATMARRQAGRANE